MPVRLASLFCSQRAARWAQLIALGFPTVVAIAALLWGRPWINPDTSASLRAWAGWIHSGQWNRVIEPSPANITIDQASWLGWWSPGQYVWTGSFNLIFGNLGVAVVLSALVGGWIKSLGIQRLLRSLGVHPQLAWWVVAVEAVGWNLYFSFGFYTGAEVVQAAYFPWFLLALVTLGRNDQPSLRWLALIPLFFLAAAVKYSMEIAAAAGGAWLAGEVLLNQARPWSAKLRAAAYVGMALIAMVLGAKGLLTRGGEDPSQAGDLPLAAHLAWSFPVTAPILSATGFGSFVSHHFFVRGQSINEGWSSLVPVMMLGAVPLALFYAWLCWAQPNRRWGRLIAWTLLTYGLAIGALFYRGASVSLEDRHFRLPGMLLLIGIAIVGLGPRQETTKTGWGRRLMGGLAVVTALYGMASSLLRIRTIDRLHHIASCGLTMPNLDLDADRELVRLDRSNAGTRNVIFLSDSSMIVEVAHSRLIQTDLANQPSRFETLRYSGRVDRLTLVLPAAWAHTAQLGRAERLFADYPASAWRSWVAGSCCFVQAGPKSD